MTLCLDPLRQLGPGWADVGGPEHPGDGVVVWGHHALHRQDQQGPQHRHHHHLLPLSGALPQVSC